MALPREKHIRLDKATLSHLGSSPTRRNASESDQSYDEITSFDSSSNGLSALPSSSLKLFKICSHLDISDNEFTRLSSILAISKTLTHLNASRNKINNVSNLASFAKLKVLNLSSNLITDIPPFHASLNLLDLSHNHLEYLPSLSSLNLLETLNLSGNEIQDLSSAASLLPSSLIFLNLSANRIDLLTSLFHLSFLSHLRSLCISSNPCILPSFNHRPFIFALFYNSLLEVDGIALLEEEILLGERMLQDKMSKFKRGGSDMESEMKEYLSQFIRPQPNSSAHNSSFDARMAKVLEKRREHESSLLSDHSLSLPSDSRSLSLHSPYSNWTRAVLNDKENEIPSQSDDLSTTLTPATNSRMDGEQEEMVVIRSVDEERVDGRTPPIPKPRMSRDERMKKAAVSIQRWWREMMGKREKKGGEEGLKRSMRHTVESLIKTATIQAECTEKLEETVKALRERVNGLESLLTPTPPSNLTIDHSKGVTRLSWRPPPPVDIYEMYVDGRLEGHVSGRSSSILLSNLPLSSSIQLKAVRGGLISAFSKSVLSD